MAQLNAAQKAALAKVASQAAASGSGRSRQYEVEAGLNERGITIHFTRGEEGPKNQGRFWFAIDGEDSGLDFTSRTGARRGAEAYLAELDGSSESA